MLNDPQQSNQKAVCFLEYNGRILPVVDHYAFVSPLDRQVRAAFAAGGVLIVGGWVDAKKAVGYVDWALLLLVGSALGLSKAIANSGLADYAGEAIRDSGMSASASLYVLYGFTMVRTNSTFSFCETKQVVCPIALSITFLCSAFIFL